MNSIYFIQAWTLIKQHRLFTIIYIMGTGLSVALIMTMFIIFYVKFAPIYPEYNRNRTLVLKMVKSYPKGNTENWSSGNLNYEVIPKLLIGLPHLEAVGALLHDDKKFIDMPDGKGTVAVQPLYTDAGFWKVFTFDFLSGSPFNQVEVDRKCCKAVISKSLAYRLFASEEVVGRTFMMDAKPYQVCGIVKDISKATPVTAGDLWLPITLNQWIKPNVTERLLGNAEIYMTAPTPADKDILKLEVQDRFRKYNLVSSEYENDLMEQPDDYWMSIFRTNSSTIPDIAGTLKVFLYIFLALLFIPAMNLSGMISSRMDQRLCELGIRRTYGATDRILLSQVLWENLLLTCIGGLLGLLISYLIVMTANQWILTLFGGSIVLEGDSALSAEMLFNPLLFATALGACIVLNLISAFIPARLALRRTIVCSLNSNR